MLNACCVVPLLLTLTALFYLSALKQLLQDRLLYSTVAVAVLDASYSWVTHQTLFSIQDIYFYFFITSYIAFRHIKKDHLRTCLIFFSLASVLVYMAEMSLGIASNTHRAAMGSYHALSDFLVTREGLISGTSHLTRTLPILGGISLIRPVGLLGNVHFGSFALIPFFLFLTLYNRSNFSKIVISSLILLGGTIQTIFAFSIFAVISHLNKKRLAIGFGVASLFGFASLIALVYFATSLPVHNDMYMLYQEAFAAAGRTRFLDLFFGVPWRVVIENLRPMNSAVSLNLGEAGLLRYTAELGLLKLAFAPWIVLNSQSSRLWLMRLAFLLALYSTLSHYFVLTTLFGAFISAVGLVSALA